MRFFKKLALIIGLLFCQINVASDLGVGETKGEMGDDRALTLNIGGHRVEVSQELINQFGLFDLATEGVFSLDDIAASMLGKPGLAFVTYENLLALFRLLNGESPEAYNVHDLINICALAGFLDLKDLTMLGAIKDRIRAQESDIDLDQLLSNMLGDSFVSVPFDLKLFLFQYMPIMNSVSKITISHDGSLLGVVLSDNNAVIFDMTTLESVVDHEDVDDIIWNPVNNAYFVMGSSSYYGIIYPRGHEHGGFLFGNEEDSESDADHDDGSNDLRAVIWSPNGQQIMLIFNPGVTILNQNGDVVYEYQECTSGSWALGGNYYLVLDNDEDDIRLHNANDGSEVRTLSVEPQDLDHIITVDIDNNNFYLLYKNVAYLFNIDRTILAPNSQARVVLELPNVAWIYGNPKTHLSWIKFNDGHAVLYGQNGHPLPGVDPIAHIDAIYWNPVSNKSFVKNNHIAVLYNHGIANSAVSYHHVRKVVWSPNGSFYFVLYNDGFGQVYDAQNNRPLGKKLAGVKDLNWDLDSKGFLIIFRNGDLQPYFLIDFLEFSLDVKVLINRIISSPELPVALTSKESAILSDDIFDLLIVNGYLVDSGDSE